MHPPLLLRLLRPASTGAQYCAWHPDSSLLAVTSDGLHATFVFNPKTRQQVRLGGAGLGG